MADLTPQVVSHAGLEATYAAATAGGDKFVNDGRSLLHVKNGGVGSITVTIDSLVNSNQGVDTNVAVVVTNGEERFIGPFNPSRFNLNDKVSVSYSGVTSVTVAVLRLGDPG